MICPACGRDDRTLYVCAPCWAKVPARDKAQLRAMHVNRQDTTSKVAKIVRELKAKP